MDNFDSLFSLNYDSLLALPPAEKSRPVASSFADTFNTEDEERTAVEDVAPIPYGMEEPQPLLTFQEFRNKFGKGGDEYVDGYLTKELSARLPNNPERVEELITAVRKSLVDQGIISSVSSLAKDAGVSLAKGGNALVQSIAGIADRIVDSDFLPMAKLSSLVSKPILKSIAESKDSSLSRGVARQLLEGDSPLKDFIRRLDENKKSLDEAMSPSAQMAEKNIGEAFKEEGIGKSAAKAWEAVKDNPSLITNKIVETLPQLAITLGVGKLFGGSRVAIGASEGALSSGGMLADIVNKIESTSPQEIDRVYKLNFPEGQEQSLEAKKLALTGLADRYAYGAGAVTGLTSGLAGKTESALVTGVGARSVLERLGFVVKGIRDESIEEGVQSASDQIANNVIDTALSGEIKNPLTGVGGAVVQGALVGGAMGGSMGGAVALRQNNAPEQTKEIQPKQPEQDSTAPKNILDKSIAEIEKEQGLDEEFIDEERKLSTTPEQIKPAEDSSTTGDITGSLQRPELPREPGSSVEQEENTSGNIGESIQRPDSNESITELGAGIKPDTKSDGVGEFQPRDFVAENPPVENYNKTINYRTPEGGLATQNLSGKALKYNVDGRDVLINEEVPKEYHNTFLNLFGLAGLNKASNTQPFLIDANKTLNGFSESLLGTFLTNPNAIVLNFKALNTSGYNEAGVVTTFAHELGHAIESQLLREASPEVIAAIEEAYKKDVTDRPKVPFKTLWPSQVYPKNRDAKNTRGDKSYVEYSRKFEEWFANQVAKWVETDEKPQNIVEKFFSTVAKQLKNFFSRAMREDFLPRKEVRDWLNSLSKAKSPVGTNEEIETKKIVDIYSAKVKDLVESPTQPLNSSVTVRTNLGFLNKAIDDKFSIRALYEDIAKFDKESAEKFKFHEVLINSNISKNTRDFRTKLVDPIIQEYKKLNKLGADKKTVDSIITAMAAYTRAREKLLQPLAANQSKATNAEEALKELLDFKERRNTTPLGATVYVDNGLEVKAIEQLNAVESELISYAQNQPKVFTEVLKNLVPKVRTATDKNKDILIKAGYPAENFANYTPFDIFGIGYLPAQLGDTVRVFKKERGLQFRGSDPIERITAQNGQVETFAAENKFKQDIWKLAAQVDVVDAKGKKVFETLPKPKVKKAPDGTIDWGIDRFGENTISFWNEGAVRLVQINDPAILEAATYLSRKGTPTELSKSAAIGVFANLQNAAKEISTGNVEQAVTSAAKAGVEATVKTVKTSQQLLGRAFTAGLSFAGVNFLRDVSSVASYLPKEYSAIKTFANYPASVALAFKNIGAELLGKDIDTSWKEAKDAGAFIDVRTNFGLETVKDFLTSELEGKSNALDPMAYLSKVDDIIAFVGNVTENATRYAVYSAVKQHELKNKVDRETAERRAAVVAKETTTNFERSSKATRFLGPLFIFANPAVQGSRTLVRNLKNNPRTLYAGLVLASLGFLKSMHCGSGSRDASGRTQCADVDNVKQDMVMAFPGMNYGFPLQYGVNLPWVIGNTIGDIASEGAINAKKANSNIVSESAKGTKRLALAATNVFSPIGSPRNDNIGVNWFLRLATPTQLVPIQDIAMNENAFGVKLYPVDSRDSRADRTPDVQNAPRTVSPTAKKVAESMYPYVDISPATLEYLTKYYTGSLGKDVQFFTTETPEPNWKGQERRPILRSMSVTPAPFEFNKEIKTLKEEVLPLLKLESTLQAKTTATKEGKALLDLAYDVDAADKREDARARVIVKEKDNPTLYRKELIRAREETRQEYLPLLARYRKIKSGN